MQCDVFATASACTIFFNEDKQLLWIEFETIIAKSFHITTSNLCAVKSLDNNVAFDDKIYSHF